MTNGRETLPDAMVRSQRLWVVSELYYPEQTSTGYFVTGIAEGLAHEYDVRVICSQPTYASRGVIAAREEVRAGVRIERCRSTRLDKDVLLLRMINIATFMAAVLVRVLRRTARGDFVLVVTNPPILPYIVTLAARMRGARVVLLIHDVFPEVLVAAGMCREGSWIVRSADVASRWLYRAVDRIVVLGRDMRTVIAAKLADGDDRIATIPNWGDTENVRPLADAGSSVRRRLGIDDKFVVQFMGNMGRSHAIEALAEAAVSLSGRDDIHFLIMGWGARRAWLEETIGQAKLGNVTLLPNCPQDELTDYLNACDIGVITFRPGMAGLSVPSRMYNVIAAGKPLLALADDDSELARMVEEERVGWVVPADRPHLLAAAILEAKDDPGRDLKGRRARIAAQRRYSARHVAAQYRYLFAELGKAPDLPLAVSQ